MTTYSKAPTTAWASITTDAIFREWGKAISDGLAAVGLVKTSDTGQIDWTTVAKPGGSNTMVGYEIWRFNDSMQGTAPLFLKIEYGSGSNMTYPGGIVTLGSGSDGAGTVSGTYSAKTITLANTSAASGTNPIFVSGGDGWVTVFALMGSALLTFSLERLLDANGDPTARGVFFTGRRGGGAVQGWAFGTSWNTTDFTCIGCSWPKKAGDDSNVKAGDYVLFVGATPTSSASPDQEFALPFEQTLALGIVHSSMGSIGDPITVPRWDGNVHTYLHTGHYGYDVSNSQYANLCIRWE